MTIKSMAIGTKLVLGFAVLLFFITCLGAVLFRSFATMKDVLGSTIESQKHETTRSLIETAYAVIAEQHALETAGKTTRAEAQSRALNSIRAMRYGEDGYFWINDLRSVMVMHPVKPELDGKDLSDFKDPTGKRLFVDFAAVAERDGAGFVPYMWPKPGHSAPVKKISFVKGFQPWGWVIGTGVYAEDVNAAASRTWVKGLRTSQWSTVTVFVAALFVGAFVVVMIRKTNATLRGIARQLSDGADHVSSAASEVSSFSQELAQGASQQAASLEETSSSVEEINSMTRSNTEHSQDSTRLMAHLAQQVTEGNRRLEQMVASMKSIRESSDKISEIIQTIDEIAFQTNILALNAAVEAARAGQSGVGFAVVADEVRRLALRCAEAAQGTTSLIEESAARSAEGAQRLDQVAQAFGSITSDAEKVKSLVDQVHGGSREQARGLEQVNQTVSQMEQVTQRVAASAEQSAAAAQRLGGQSEALRDMVVRLMSFVSRTDAAQVN